MTSTTKLNAPCDLVASHLAVAVRNELQAREATNKAHLLNLLLRPTGIGEHTRLVDDILDHLARYTAARDERAAFEELFVEMPPDCKGLLEHVLDGAARAMQYAAIAEKLQAAQAAVSPETSQE